MVGATGVVGSTILAVMEERGFAAGEVVALASERSAGTAIPFGGDELIVRALIGWGGRGMRGDTERIGQKLLSSLYQQVVASGYSLGEAEQARLPSIGGGSGLTCAHCGYEAGSATAFYCPKCGMRMVRGA